MGQRCSKPAEYIPILRKMITRTAEILGTEMPSLPDEKDPCDTLTKLELIYRDMITSGLKSCANPTDKLSPEQLFLLSGDDKIYCVSAEEIPEFFTRKIDPYTNKEINEGLRNELELIYRLYMANSYYEARSKYDYLLCLDRKNRPAGQFDDQDTIEIRKWVVEFFNRPVKTDDSDEESDEDDGDSDEESDSDDEEKDIPGRHFNVLPPEKNGEVFQAGFYYYNHLIANDAAILRRADRKTRQNYALICLIIANKFYGTTALEMSDRILERIGLTNRQYVQMELNVLAELSWNVCVATSRAFASVFAQYKRHILNKIDYLVVWSIAYGLNYPANILAEAALLLVWDQDEAVTIYWEESVQCVNDMIKTLRGKIKFNHIPSVYEISEEKPIRGNWEICRPGRLLHRQNYIERDVLGRGTFGKVSEAISSGGRTVAIKETKLDDHLHYTTIREIGLLRELEHPNIITLYDVKVNRNNIVQVMEKMAGSLNKKIDPTVKFDLATRREIMRQLLTGLRYCHFRNIAHRDLKPTNILFLNDTYKLADFGLGRVANALGDKMTPDVITVWYRPPELFSDEDNEWYNPFAADMWSMGCIMGELFRGRPLFAGQSNFDILLLILRTIPMSEKDWTKMKEKYWPRSLRGFQRQIIPPPLRDQFAEMDANEFDLFSRLLTVNPKRRIIVERALQHPYFASQ